MPETLPTDPRVLAVVPAFNEEASVARTIEELKEAHPDLDILVVDDGSGDRTAAIAPGVRARSCASSPTTSASAARCERDTATRFATATTLPSRSTRTGSTTRRTSSCWSTRLEPPTSWSAPGSPARATTARAVRAGGRCGCWRSPLTRLAHNKMTDVTSGFRAANRRAIRVFADHYPAEYLGDTVESLVIAIRAGCTVTQVPVHMRVRAGGQASQTPLKASVYLLRAVVALGLALVRKWPTTLENLSEEDL